MNWILTESGPILLGSVLTIVIPTKADEILTRTEQILTAS